MCQHFILLLLSQIRKYPDHTLNNNNINNNNNKNNNKTLVHIRIALANKNINKSISLMIWNLRIANPYKCLKEQHRCAVHCLNMYNNILIPNFRFCMLSFTPYQKIAGIKFS